MLPSKDLPTYEPPYESPIEDLFAFNVIKYVDEDRIEFRKQVSIDTICGCFRLDFMIVVNDRVIAIECDGAKFHKGRELHDEYRDALILGTGSIDAIYRFRGKDLCYHLEDCLLVLSQWEPSAFSDRGRTNLKNLASDFIRDRCENGLTDWDGNLMASVGSSDRDDGEYFVIPPSIYVKRTTKLTPPGMRQHWTYQYEFARKSGCKSFDDLMKKVEESHRDMLGRAKSL